MGRCYVEIRGKDGTIHTLTLDAADTFDAADQAIQSWYMFWWFDPDAIVTVQHAEKRWNISQARVREWRQGSRNP
jgi:hypothetical protein